MKGDYEELEILQMWILKNIDTTIKDVQHRQGSVLLLLNTDESEMTRSSLNLCSISELDLGHSLLLYKTF